jgi:hypothetical protein
MARPEGTKYIETPEKMWELFEAYVLETKSNPFQLPEQRKGTIVIPKGTPVEEIKNLLDPVIDLPRERALTMVGFLNYLDTQGIITDATDYFENKDKRYSDYVRICLRIKRSIQQDQIEGGMAGIYNPSITQRLNGLVEKTANENTNRNFDITMDLGDKKPDESNQGG